MTTSSEQLSSLRASASTERVPFWQALLEKDLVPDWVIRRGIRALVRARLEEETRVSEEASAAAAGSRRGWPPWRRSAAGSQCQLDCTVEVEGGGKPALLAEVLFRYYA